MNLRSILPCALVCSVTFIAACGTDAAPAAPAPPAPGTTASPIAPAAPALAPAAPAPAPTVPTRCRVEPESGVVVARGRRAPEVMVGARSVMVLHRPLRAAGLCRDHAQAAGFALPLAQGAAPVPYAGGVCGRAEFPEEGIGSHGRLERIAGEPVFLACAQDDEPVRWCAARFHGPSLGGFASISDWVETHVTEAGLGTDLAVGDGYYYVAADMGHGVEGRRHVAGETEVPRDRVIGPTPSGGAREGVRIEIAESTRERTVILYGTQGSDTAFRVVMGADGTREAPPERTTWPPAPEPALRVIEERPSPRDPPRVRLVRAGGAPVAIEGLPDDAAPSSPALVEVGGGARVLVFVEGLGEAKRTWGAFLDAGAGAITGRFRIGTGESEAHDVHADGANGVAVVAWSAREPDGRVLRAAQLVCE